MGNCVASKNESPKKASRNNMDSLEQIPDSEQKTYRIQEDKQKKSLKFENAPLINSQYLYNKFHYDSNRPQEINLQWQVDRVNYHANQFTISIINRIPVNVWVVCGGKEIKTITGLYLSINNYQECQLFPVLTTQSGNPLKINLQSRPKKVKIILQSISNPKLSLNLINSYQIEEQNLKLLKQQLMWSSLAFQLQNIYNQSQQNLNDQIKQNIECVICNVEPSSCILVPCRHMCICKLCLPTFNRMYKTCPLCKQIFTELIVYKQIRN